MEKGEGWKEKRRIEREDMERERWTKKGRKEREEREGIERKRGGGREIRKREGGKVWEGEKGEQGMEKNRRKRTVRGE